jgi:hypothetical protein
MEIEKITQFSCSVTIIKVYFFTNPHWAHVVGYGPFSLYVIHKEGLCPSGGDFNRLMMMVKVNF